MSTLPEANSVSTDVAVIGSGPGGYVCAIRLAQLGKKAVLIEKEHIGGVCLNVGCIPSKALITVSKHVKGIRNAAKMGVNAQLTIDYPKLQEWKQSVVERLTNNVALLCKANKIVMVHGTATIEAVGKVLVRDGSQETAINCSDIVIASGSAAIELPSLKFDGQKVISSTEALALKEPPKKMLIVGGGVIGLEIGMAYANLFGTQLIIVEVLDQLLPGLDLELVNAVSRRLQQLGASIHLKSKVKSASKKGEQEQVIFETPEGKEESVEVDCVLVSVGRKPNSKGMGLEELRIQLDAKGYIQVNEKMESNVQHVYAIGDVRGGPLLAHKASKEGIVAAEVIAGMKSSFDSVAMPSAIFTDPEIATVGMMTDAKEAQQRGEETQLGKYPFAANGRAMASSETEGFVKILADKQTGQLLGVSIVGAEASDLISELSLALEMGATLEDLALTIHPHPTLPEAIMEAAENALGRAIHIQNRPMILKKGDGAGP